jgi:hypothetical protein
MGDPMDEVGRPVDGIDVDRPRMLEGATVTLFTYEGIVGKMLREAFEDDLFGTDSIVMIMPC